jgi:hypothetical protein
MVVLLIWGQSRATSSCGHGKEPLGAIESDLTGFCGFPQSLQVNAGWVLRLNHDSVFPNPSSSSCFQSSWCSTVYSLDILSVVKWPIKIKSETEQVGVAVTFQASKNLLAACFTLVSAVAFYSDLKMEATCSSKTWVEFQRTARRYIPVDSNLLIRLCSEGTWFKSYPGHRLSSLRSLVVFISPFRHMPECYLA